MKSRYMRPSLTSTTFCGTRRADGADEIADRHGGEEIIACEGGALVLIASMASIGSDVVVFDVDAVDVEGRGEFHRLVDDEFGGMFPELAGAEFGIKEASR